MSKSVQAYEKNVTGGITTVVEADQQALWMLESAVVGEGFMASDYHACVSMVLRYALRSVFGDEFVRKQWTYPEAIEGPRVLACAHSSNVINIFMNRVKSKVKFAAAEQRYVFENAAYIAKYVQAAEGGRGALPLPSISGGEQVMAVRNSGGNSEKAVAASLRALGIEVWPKGITTTPVPGASDGAITQKRIASTQIGKGNFGVFAATTHHDLMALLVHELTTHVRTNGHPDKWFARAACINKEPLSPIALGMLRTEIAGDPPFDAGRMASFFPPLEGKDAASTAAYLLQSLVVAPFNAKADPGMPFCTPGGNSKEARFAYSRERVADFIKLVEKLSSSDASGGFNLNVGASDVFRLAWKSLVDQEPVLGVFNAKPKFDTYAGDWRAETVRSRKGAEVSGMVPYTEKDPRYYFSQPLVMRMITTLGADALGAGMRSFGNCVTYARDGGDELVIEVADWSSAAPGRAGCLPWSALGFCPYGGGMEAMHVLLMREADLRGFALAMYGDDSIMYYKVGAHIIALGGDASRFDLSQPFECRELFQYAYMDPIDERYGPNGPAAMIHGSLGVVMDGLFSRSRPAITVGEVIAVFPGGTASGGRCLTESNSVIAYACMMRIIRHIQGATVKGSAPGDDTADKAVAWLRREFIAGAKVLSDDTGMNFGVEAIGVVTDPEVFGPDAVGPMLHPVPFLGRNFRAATTSRGVKGVVGTLEAKRADSKIVFENGKNDETSQEKSQRLCAQIMSYHLDSGFMDEARSSMANTFFKSSGAVVCAAALGESVPAHLLEEHVYHGLPPDISVLRFHTGEARKLGTRVTFPTCYVDPKWKLGYRSFDDTGTCVRPVDQLHSVREVEKSYLTGVLPPRGERLVKAKLMTPERATMVKNIEHNVAVTDKRADTGLLVERLAAGTKGHAMAHVIDSGGYQRLRAYNTSTLIMVPDGKTEIRLVVSAVKQHIPNEVRVVPTGQSKLMGSNDVLSVALAMVAANQSLQKRLGIKGSECARFAPANMCMVTPPGKQREREGVVCVNLGMYPESEAYGAPITLVPDMVCLRFGANGVARESIMGAAPYQGKVRMYGGFFTTTELWDGNLSRMLKVPPTHPLLGGYAFIVWVPPTVSIPMLKDPRAAGFFFQDQPLDGSCMARTERSLGGRGLPSAPKQSALVRHAPVGYGSGHARTPGPAKMRLTQGALYKARKNKMNALVAAAGYDADVGDDEGYASWDDVDYDEYNRYV